MAGEKKEKKPEQGVVFPKKPSKAGSNKKVDSSGKVVVDR
jgi:hypothetical protein